MNRKRASIRCDLPPVRWGEIDDKGQKTCRPSGRTGNKSEDGEIHRHRNADIIAVARRPGDRMIQLFAALRSVAISTKQTFGDVSRLSTLRGKADMA